MLRRRKADVESELPGRTVKNYFVPMVEEQRLRYEDYRQPAARLIALAQRRPLLPAEFDRLQMLLACMRMICDTPAILDPTCRISPKLEELEGILGDLLEEPDRKIIVFSEWERMLELVRELAAEMGVEAAWHTGSVPQQRRRAEIMRFKQDPACRLFLSTDSGSVGLNLQVASAVVNVDLPWNPAKLEQRIARAWRKNQTRSVTVVNLVCEDSIEHQILHLLGQKQALADGVLDGQGDLAALKMPSGRAAMIERMQAMMQAAEASVAPRIVPAEEAVAEELRRRHGERALLIEARTGGDGRVRVLAVLDLDGEALAAEAKRHEAAPGRRTSGRGDRPRDLARHAATERERDDHHGRGSIARAAPVAGLRGRRRSERRSAGAARGVARRSRAGAAHGARAGGRRLPRRGAAADRQGDRCRRGRQAGGARRACGRRLAWRRRRRCATWSSEVPSRRRRRSRPLVDCGRCRRRCSIAHRDGGACRRGARPGEDRKSRLIRRSGRRRYSDAKKSSIAVAVPSARAAS